jgi:hypothetical protein
MLSAWVPLEAGAALRHMPAEEFGVPVLGDAEQ